MAAYLTPIEFRARTIMPSAYLDQLEASASGFIAARLLANTGWLNARLAKRYDTPFASPVPEIVLGWLTALTTLDCYMRRGFNPSAEQDSLIAKLADDAKAELKEAADSKDGLFDLPIREDKNTSGISRAGPLAQGDASPYTWIDDVAGTLAGGGR